MPLERGRPDWWFVLMRMEFVVAAPAWSGAVRSSSRGTGFGRVGRVGSSRAGSARERTPRAPGTERSRETTMSLRARPAGCQSLSITFFMTKVSACSSCVTVRLRNTGADETAEVVRVKRWC